MTEKPWAKLGWTRRKWDTMKLWKKAGVSKEKFSEFILAIPDDTIREIADHAHAEALVEGIFGALDEK